MGDRGVGALLVTSGGKVVGIVTDRDIAVRGVGAGGPLPATVGDVMTEHPVTVEGSADVFEAYRALRAAGVRRLPVLEAGELGGIVTVDDLLVSLVLELAAVVSPVAWEMLRPEFPA